MCLAQHGMKNEDINMGLALLFVGCCLMFCERTAGQACDVLYTDLMSPMYPDDNTHSLMLRPQQLVQVLILTTCYATNMSRFL